MEPCSAGVFPMGGIQTRCANHEHLTIIATPCHTISRTAKPKSICKGSIACSSAATEGCCQGLAAKQKALTGKRERRESAGTKTRKNENQPTPKREKTRKNEKTRKTRKCEMLRKPCVLLQNMKNEKREKTRKNEN